MDFALALIYCLLFAYLIARSRVFRIQGLAPAWVIGAFALKVVVGTGLWFIYSHHYVDTPRYTLDTFKYFDDAGFMHTALQHSPMDWLRIMFGIQTDAPSVQPYLEGMNNWERSDTLIAINDNKTMIRANALIRLISFGSYHVHAVVFNFLSLLGLVLLFKGLRRLIDLPAPLFLLLCVLPPSLLFWASGVLKESMVMAAIGIFFYGAISWWAGDRLREQLLPLVLGGALLIGIKPYVVLSLIPASLFMLMCRRSENAVLLKWLGLHLGLLVAVYLTQYSDASDIVWVLSHKRDAFVNVAADTAAGSAISIPELGSFWKLLLALPSALINSLYRPTILEADGPLLWAAALENALYLLLSIAALGALAYRRQRPWRLILACLSIVLCISAIVGLVTPVLGAVVRYKAPMLPFLLLLIFLLIDGPRLRSFSAHLWPR